MIQELNTKAAYVAAPGGAGIRVESLAGTCVLSAGGAVQGRAAGMARSQGIEAHLSGRIGHVVMVSHGGPVKVYLPHSAGEHCALFSKHGYIPLHVHGVMHLASAQWSQAWQQLCQKLAAPSKSMGT